MWATVNEILTKIDDFVWGPPLMVLIMVGGILLTIRMGVLQIRKLPLALKWTGSIILDGTCCILRNGNQIRRRSSGCQISCR